MQLIFRSRIWAQSLQSLMIILYKSWHTGRVNYVTFLKVRLNVIIILQKCTHRLWNVTVKSFGECTIKFSTGYWGCWRPLLWFRFHKINTLQFPRDLGMLNSTTCPKPSSWSDLVALLNSASAIASLERLPCLKLRNDTTGPCASRALSFTVWMVGCSIVLS